MSVSSTKQSAIEDHGIVGDMRTCALVDIEGTVDWLCYPHFDSPSVFAALLDREKGGHFRIAPVHEVVGHKQWYWPDTNVLVTRFLCTEGMGELFDFMPVTGRDGLRSSLIRQLRVVRGELRFQIDCQPRFDYGRARHETQILEQGALFHGPDLRLKLDTPARLTPTGSGVQAEVVLGEGESVAFALHGIDEQVAEAPQLDPEQILGLFEETVVYWREWLAHCTYKGRWREQVERSALLLKLLTFEPTGAIVAAPTTSLPEAIGGTRNWDYRYTWIRDAAFSIYGLLRIGFTAEAARFMEWIEARCQELEDGDSLRIAYGIDGRHRLPEESLDHLAGYRDSRPVRIGNDAYEQLQLDTTGALLDSAYLFNKHGTAISYGFWCQLRRLVDWLEEHWQMEDEGIWEFRSGRRPFVYSKVMCWVAVDRALRLAQKRSFPADRARWEKLRDRIYEDVMEHGWDAENETFVQSYGSRHLDASSLIMPLVFFMSPNDPRMLSTLDAIQRSPREGGLMESGLVYRYLPEEVGDGLEGREGSFNMCTFWLVEALTRAGHVDRPRLERARLHFEQMLSFSNHLGLYAEQTGPCGEALGNFPQAFTHLALISAAYNLDRALG